MRNCKRHLLLSMLLLALMSALPLITGDTLSLQAAGQAQPEGEAPPKKPPSEDVVKLYNTGRELYAQGKLDEAVAVYKKVVEMDPGFDYAYGSLGYIYYDQGNFNEALVMLEKAISLSPEDSFYHSEAALVYEKLGRRKDGILSLQKAIELKPDNWLYYRNLAGMKMSDGDKEGAAAAFEKALALCKDRKEKKLLRERIEELKTGRKPETKK